MIYLAKVRFIKVKKTTCKCVDGFGRKRRQETFSERHNLSRIIHKRNVFVYLSRDEEKDNMRNLRQFQINL